MKHGRKMFTIDFLIDWLYFICYNLLIITPLSLGKSQLISEWSDQSAGMRDNCDVWCSQSGVSDILLCADDDIDTVTLSRLGRNVRSQEQLDDVLTSWRLSSEYNADLRFNWMVHLVHVHFSRSNKPWYGLDTQLQEGDGISSPVIFLCRVLCGSGTSIIIY